MDLAAELWLADLDTAGPAPRDEPANVKAGDTVMLTSRSLRPLRPV